LVYEKGGGRMHMRRIFGRVLFPALIISVIVINNGCTPGRPR
jgi:hypothetical protein